MAVWQFDLNFVPAGYRVKRKANGALVGADLTVAHSLFAQVHLEQYFEPHSKVSPAWVTFGEADANCVDIITEGSVAEISARIDTRTNSDQFCIGLCELADRLKCDFLDVASGSVFKPALGALYTQMMDSPAWKFALDEQAYLATRTGRRG